MKNLFVCILCLLLLSCNESKQVGDTIDDVEDNDEINSSPLVLCDACDCSNPPTGILVWDYPVKPGTDEWKDLKDYPARIKICQIPEEILFSLTTEELTEICLQYPFLSTDVFSFDFRVSANELYKNFNGIRELFEREDASKELLRHYIYKLQNMSILDDESATTLEKGRFKISIQNLEFLLGFYSQKVDATEEDYMKILRCLLAGHEKEFVYANPNFAYSFLYNFYARTHIIIKISPQSLEKIPEKMFNQVFNARPGKETIDIINELSYQLIKES